MFRKGLLLSFIFLLTTCFQVAAQTSAPAKTEGPSVDELLTKSIDAMGGAEKFKALKTLKMTGKMVVQNGAMEMPMVIQVKQPGAFRADTTVMGKVITQAFDGTSGWQISPMTGKLEAEKMSDEDVRRTREGFETMVSGPFSNYKEKGTKIELVGKEDVEGTAAYNLKVTTKDGESSNVFLDSESYLPIKILAKSKQGATAFEMEMYPSDYKAVNGIMFSHSMEGKIKGGPAGAGFQMVMEKIEVDVPIDDAVFKMPAASK